MANKDTINSDIQGTLSYSYKAIDEFSSGGGKVSNLISKNTIFVDCKYLHKDLYDIVYELAMILEDKNIVLYAALRPRLNQILIYIRDRLSVCDYAPEVNVLLKNSTDYYLADHYTTHSAPATIPEMADKLLNSFKKNIDGSTNTNEINLQAPIYTDMHSREMIQELQSSINLVLIIMLFLLSSVVVYTLMLADVEE